MDEQLIGVDVGTTGLKAVVVGPDGRLLGQASAPYDTLRPQPGWTEQPPEWWWEACRSVLGALRAGGALRPEAAIAIGLTGQMHGSVFLDEADRVVRPAIMWNDQRTAAECKEIEQRVGLQRLIDLTGNRALTGFTAPKLLWLRKHEPESYARTRHLLLPKDYVRLRMTGERATDVADASGTLLFDVRSRKWSSEVVEAIEVPPEWLPPALESPQVSGRLTPQAASALGLPAGIPVVAGAGDQAAGGVGSGAVEEGVITASLGTSGVVFSATLQPRVDPQARLHSFCHAAHGLWHLMGVMLAAGGSFQWLADTLRPLAEGERMEEKLSVLAAGAPTGSGGLVFLPYLAGERTPHADPFARGAFVGLRAEHGLPHLARAVMEGVAFGLRDSLELIREMGVSATEVRAIGGGARSRLWRQILADVFACPVVSLEADEGPAFGAALLAGIGAEIFASVSQACHTTIRLAERLEPERKAVEVYEGLYRRYRELYPLLRDTFHALSGFDAASGR
ncbi:MAG: xylulokinase [Dehalococcoidia bacterium]|nr:xylulokinase [Dehalococcoidia bacterium]